MNFSRTVADITKWFWVTIAIEGYLNYLLPKFEDLDPTSLGSEAIYTRLKCVTVTADYCIGCFHCMGDREGIATNCLATTGTSAWTTACTASSAAASLAGSAVAA